ncbi:lysylphosphatidylglycerol synthetase family protein, partial [Thioclava sp. BHET1]
MSRGGDCCRPLVSRVAERGMEQQRTEEKTRARLWKDRLSTAAPILVGIALFTAGLGALFHLLAPIDLRHVIATAKHTPAPVLAGALLATAGGYAALIGYDWSALRHIGRKLPLPVVAMGGFLGYSLGNTIGISILSGGAVRYRIYSAFGISALEIAAISTFVSLAFGVGISIIGLTALIIHPASLEQFTSLTPGKVQLIAALALALTIGLIGTASVAGRAIRIWRFELRAPSPGILLGQLFFTAIDTCLAALALYILIPPGGPDFVTFLVIFATAGMVGVLSHVPGGIGVFESVVIAALPPNVSVEQAAVGLLLFRIIYYLVPFVIAMVVISINEARLASGPLRRLLGDVSDTMRPVSGAMSSIAPAAAAASALGLGIYLLLMALMPSVRPIDAGPKDILGAVLLEGGAWLSAVLGLLMILLAQGLMRRISAAFLLTEIALIGGAAASLLNGVSISGALILLGAAVLIWPIRGEFYRAARLTQNQLSPGWFALMLGIALSAMLFLFLMQENTPYSHELLLRFSYNANAPRALRAGLAASALLCFVLIYLALQPARARPSPPDAAALQRAREIIALQGDPLACLALAGDKSFLFAETGDAFMMYAAQGKSWIAYGDPVGNPAVVRDLAWAFFDAALAAGCRPIFYEVTDAYRPVWVELGMTVNEIGEDAS